MAPRIRLNIAKPLPTINEALEDILEDITSNTKSFGSVYMSPDSCSGEDYLQSICQLTRPTFPLPPESKRKVQDIDKLEMLHHGQRILSKTPSIAHKYKLTDTLPNLMSLERNGFILDHVKSYSSSKAGPLEEMNTEAQKTYQWRCPNGSENTVYSQLGTNLCTPRGKSTEKQGVVGFPRFPSPRPVQRENSCPELKSLKHQGKMPTLESGPNQEENVVLIVNGKSIYLYPPRENQLCDRILRSSHGGLQTLKCAASPEREQWKSSIYHQNMKREVSDREGCVEYFYIDQKATSHHWISEFRCAWKEAKVRACSLPAIAEL